MLIALRLAKEGYAGGDPRQILEMPTDLVLTMLEHVQFQSDYETTIFELNKPK